MPTLPDLRVGQRPDTNDGQAGVGHTAQVVCIEGAVPQIMERAAARRAEIGPDAYAAELSRDLATLFPKS